MNWDESKHPRDDEGKFTDSMGKTYRQNASYADIVADGKALTGAEQKRMKELGYSKNMTAMEKIASVHIDFEKDNILPELNEEDLEKIGVDKNKSVLLKASTIQRNLQAHGEVSIDNAEEIISGALYNPTDVFLGNDEKPYYTFAKTMRISQKNGDEIYGLVLLDVEESKSNFEVVHWHWVRARSFETLKKKNNK